jgi:hypothetical protein
MLKRFYFAKKTSVLMILLLVSFLALWLIPYLRKIFHDQNLPPSIPLIIAYFFLISTLQIIFYFLFFKFFSRIFLKKYFKIFLLLVLIAAIIFLALPPQGSVDLTNYIFYAKILAHYGENPYLHSINEFSADPFFSDTNPCWRGVTPYGPVWILLSLVPYKISPSLLLHKVFAFKILSLFFWFAVGYLIFFILKKIKPEIAHFGTLLYFFNPLLLFEALNNGHNDIVFVFFVLLAVYFYLDNKKTLVLPVLAVSFLIKYVSLILFPLVLLILWDKKKNKNIFSLVTGVLLSLIIVFLALWPFTFSWGAMLASLFNQAAVPRASHYFSPGPLIFSLFFSFLNNQSSWITFLSFGLFILGYLYLLIEFLKKKRGIIISISTVFFLYLAVATFWLQPWYFVWLIPLLILKLDKPVFSFLIFAVSLIGFWSYIFPSGLLLFLLIAVILILKIKGTDSFFKYFYAPN